MDEKKYKLCRACKQKFEISKFKKKKNGYIYPRCNACMYKTSNRTGQRDQKQDPVKELIDKKIGEIIIRKRGPNKIDGTHRYWVECTCERLCFLKKRNILLNPEKSPDKEFRCLFCNQVKYGEDLESLFPEVAKELKWLNPSRITAFSSSKQEFVCSIGHQYTAVVYDRTKLGRNCIYCENNKVLPGFNSLKDRYPEIAKEAYGWDPDHFLPGGHGRKEWRCSKKHPPFPASIKQRVAKKTKCPYCAGQKAIKGVNDIKTLLPELAKEAYKWDPSELTPNSGISRLWQCSKKHPPYPASPDQRTRPSGCPYCSGREPIIGENDLQTEYPEIAAEAYNWDPSTVKSRSGLKKDWICQKGHIWPATPDSRVGMSSGCPFCADYGFNREDPAWMYLMIRPGEQQFGITNHLEIRLNTHKRNGWRKQDFIGPYTGDSVFIIENKIKKWLRLEIGLVPGKHENWYLNKLRVEKLQELFNEAKLIFNSTDDLFSRCD